VIHTLIDSHRRIRDCTFRRPATRSLGWGDVWPILGATTKAAETDLIENQSLARGWDFYSLIAASRIPPLSEGSR
jgi:hypothetical protein